MPLFYSKENPSSKKAKTFETTLGSTQGGLNLNEEADGSGEEVREVRPIGRDRAKNKAASSSCFESSSVRGGGLFTVAKRSHFGLEALSCSLKQDLINADSEVLEMTSSWKPVLE
ncbi:hypothetical protein Tco_0145488 [Tanacetum coccineum]